MAESSGITRPWGEPSSTGEAKGQGSRVESRAVVMGREPMVWLLVLGLVREPH